MAPINVVGLGYLGLSTALMFAAQGLEVVGTDCNEELVKKLQEGKTDFFEEGLEELWLKARQNKIIFTPEYQVTDVYIIAVPTPYNKENKKLDPLYLVKALEQISAICLPEAIIVLESTVLPGIIDKFVRPIIQKLAKTVHLVYAPQRLIPGNLVKELRHNSRIIGADDRLIGEKIQVLYQSFCRGEIILTDIQTAERAD